MAADQLFQPNGVPYQIEEGERQSPLEGPQPLRCLGCALGPSATDPAFRHHASSNCVDLQREYDYPEGYRDWLPGLAVLSVMCLAGYLIITYTNRSVSSLSDLAWGLRMLGVGFGIIFGLVHLLHCCFHSPSAPAPLSRTELYHLVGRTTCTFWSVVLLLGFLCLDMARAPEGLAFIHGALYLFQSLASILVLTPSWLLGNCLTKEPIKAGLLVSMFWCGALFSAGTSGEFNTRLLYFWRDWDPACHAKSPLGPTWPYDDPYTSCVAKALVEWILTPGIVEESMKLLVLLRLVPSLEDAMRSLWLTRCPRMSTFQCLPCCGWFLKLAASPVVVVLCGMSSVGAGFSTRENVSYIGRIKGQVESTRNLLPAVGRLIAAVLHISLTGTCAFFLAVSLFKGKAYRWAKYLGWALMVVAHGSFDAFLTFNQAVPLHECYFRATCDQTTRKCTIDKKGMLAGCRCSSGVDPETRRCKGRKANGNTSELTLSTDFTDLAKAEDFWELAADRRWGADCNQLPENSYICGAVYVSWFPIWPAPILGLLIIITFTLLGCCATPRLERSFQSSAGSEVMETELPARPIQSIPAVNGHDG
ncbi:Uncharacterized protein SCF082_LOCUS8180 [Durusdinium trenchii]|uniref:Uncharacterized protein n=2 Tax=Durusdinium trenchii TaxID=1381693 RepID=A0ABP0IRF8_9DINO